MDKSKGFKILYISLTSLLVLFLAFMLINFLELIYVNQDFNYSLPFYLKLIIFSVSLLTGIPLGFRWFKLVYEKNI